MLKYKLKKKKQLKIKMLSLGIYFIMFIFIYLFNDMGYIQYKKRENSNKKLEKEIYEKMQLLNQLEEEKNRLEEDIEYIEKIARQEFKMAKKDEKVFTIINNQPKKENNQWIFQQ